MLHACQVQYSQLVGLGSECGIHLQKEVAHFGAEVVLRFAIFVIAWLIRLACLAGMAVAVWLLGMVAHLRFPVSVAFGDSRWPGRVSISPIAAATFKFFAAHWLRAS
jgi:hypothetical protein